MKHPAHQAILVLGVLLLAPAAASAADCRTVRAPGGGFMTECPSESPNVPRASLPPPAPSMPYPPPASIPYPPPGNYPAMCMTPAGNCSVLFRMPPSPGTSCFCHDPVGNQFWGSTWLP